MRTIVHLSDLHFGRISPALLGPLRAAVAAARPDVVAVSGDLTQRARTAQFHAAGLFLATLPEPRIVVPGNHDIPLRNPLSRLVAPLARFHRLIEASDEPFHADDEVAVIGISTVRRLAIKEGSLGDRQADRLRARLAGLPRNIVRIVVSHHPFEAAADPPDRFRRILRECGISVLLSGHLHRSSAVPVGHLLESGPASALLVEAGTATSTRQRGEGNTFNLLEIDGKMFTVWQMEWRQNAHAYGPTRRQVFLRTESGFMEAL